MINALFTCRGFLKPGQKENNIITDIEKITMIVANISDRIIPKTAMNIAVIAVAAVQVKVNLDIWLLVNKLVIEGKPAR